ncbi:uncharacterized protein LOC119765946 [Culex quinquefasciatus]|uniref:uncharacterized protein LOC119765946 n=1 Tax=Culex quinquefasciatus TaxID=7176 RepID=UPI0018E37AE2|nr:uncharacterized protein LOC119765946 [Culex quinquefasciatus]
MIKKPSKAQKTKKTVTSKIDSGIVKRPSTVTFVEADSPRKSSTISRSNLRQTASSPQTTVARIHPPGKLPSYLSRDRPSTASSRYRSASRLSRGEENDGEVAERVLHLEDSSFERFRADVDEQYRSYRRSKALVGGGARSSGSDCGLEEEVARVCRFETERIDSAVQVGSPPSEGAGEAAEFKLKVMVDEYQKLEDKYNAQTGKLVGLEKRFNKLEDEGLVKDVAIREFEQRNKENLRTIADLRQELKEKRKNIMDMSEKSMERDSKLERLKKEHGAVTQRLHELCGKLDELQQDSKHKLRVIGTKDVQIKTLRAEVKNLSDENVLLLKAKKPDDILLKIRSRLLEMKQEWNNVGGSAEEFRNLKLDRLKLLEILQHLKKENRDMKTALSNCGLDELPSKDCELIESESNQRALFDSDPEEEITSRIVY